MDSEKYEGIPRECEECFRKSLMSTFPSGGLIWICSSDAIEKNMSKAMWMQWWDRDTMEYIIVSDKPFVSGPHSIDSQDIFIVDEMALLMYMSKYTSCVDGIV